MENYEVLQRNLENRGFTVRVANSQEEVIPILKELVPEGAQIGIPGSVTIRQLGIIENFKMLGHKVIDTWEDRKSVV